MYRLLFDKSKVPKTNNSYFFKNEESIHSIILDLHQLKLVLKKDRNYSEHNLLNFVLSKNNRKSNKLRKTKLCDTSMTHITTESIYLLLQKIDKMINNTCNELLIITPFLIVDNKLSSFPQQYNLRFINRNDIVLFIMNIKLLT